MEFDAGKFKKLYLSKRTYTSSQNCLRERSGLVKKILTRLAVARKAASNGDTVYRSPRIYLPTKLTDDSSFPFKEGDILSGLVDRRVVLIQMVRRSIGQPNGAG